ncbi:E3 ubiquitin-protein ligase CCNB1IP1 homolog [Salvia miltiorrhiza]|uniref:E3 ubiquitin-protein ligase CCNB1IP1 homolog n=1 Tax=Salvia miltiorrhiza TaxID=226208 RepID=UPI0025AC7070|nr:E3 ubiquitin-protein ligase CCNB1IP1 homolog [Salvia miltiorrhiza]
MEMEWKFNTARNPILQNHEKLKQKLEEAVGAYQKISERCGILELENEKLSKEILQLQEKFSELSRQKRKLDEMNNQTIKEIESLYRSAIKRANLSFAHWSALTADTPGPSSHPSFGAGVGSRANSLMSLKDHILSPSYNASRARHNNSNRPFDMSGGSPAKRSAVPTRAESGKGVPSSHPSFGGVWITPSKSFKKESFTHTAAPTLPWLRARVHVSPLTGKSSRKSINC